VVGIAWYSADQWQRMRETVEDADDFEETYDQWLANAESAYQQLSSSELSLERVPIDVDRVIAWCEEHGRRVTRASVAAYALNHVKTADAAPS
jgi:hypothetical protein